jgi:RNA polymerase sigma factor (sigma-70 family)
MSTSALNDEAVPTAKMEPHGSEVLGTLSEIRGFVTASEQVALGPPLPCSASDDPFQDLYQSRPKTYERANEDRDLIRLYDLRTEVACLCLSTLTTEEIGKLAEVTGLPTAAIEAARDLAVDALKTDDVTARQRAATTLMEQLASSTAASEELETNDLLGHLRRLGRWPGDASLNLVETYKRALGEAVVRHSPFAFWRMRHFVKAPPPLFQLVALQGLRDALLRFDPHRGNTVTTYASAWVRQRVQRSLETYRTDVRGPVHFWDTRWRVIKELRAHLFAFGNLPSLDEILSRPELADRANLEKVVHHGLEPQRDVWTTICEGSEPEAAQLHDTGQSYAELQRRTKLLRALIGRALANAQGREGDIIVRRYGLDVPEETLQDIGVSYGISRERIRQLQERFLERAARQKGRLIGTLLRGLETRSQDDSAELNIAQILASHGESSK